MATILLRGAALLSFCAFQPVAHGQLPSVTSDLRTPMPGHDYIGMLNEVVDPSSGSVSIRIPLATPPGRGFTLPIQFAYDSNGLIGVSGEQGRLIAGWGDVNFAELNGWSYTLPQVGAIYSLLPGYNQGLLQGNFCPVTTNFMFRDASGSRHSFQLGLPDTEQCNKALVSLRGTYSDDDGFYNISIPNGTTNVGTAPIKIWDKDGTLYHFPNLSSCSGSPGSSTNCSTPDFIEDRNGNTISISTNDDRFPITVQDTAGRTSLSISSFASAAGDTISVSGLSQPYTIQWGSKPYNYTIPVTTQYDYPDCVTVYAPTGQGSYTVVTSIALPNGTSYVFDYDPITGLLDKITYPSKASVRYTWGHSTNDGNLVYYGSGNPQYHCNAHYNGYVITQRTVNDGIRDTQIRTFAYSTDWSGGDPWKQTTVITRDLVTAGQPSIRTVYSYSKYPVEIPYILSQYYPSSFGVHLLPVEKTIANEDFSGAILNTVSKTWTGVNGSLPLGTTTTLDNGLTSSLSYTYDSNSNVVETDETDFGAGSPGPVLRKTLTSYAPFSATWFGGAITDRPCKVVVQDGSSNPLAETDTLYDGGITTCGSPGTPAVSPVGGMSPNTHDETNYGTGSTFPRGNATSVTKKCLQNCTNSTATYSYDETGQVVSATDGKNYLTTYTYADSPSGSNPTGNSNAYLTQITYPVTNGVAHLAKFSFNYTTGQLASSTDENGNLTNYTYNTPPSNCATPDGMNRLSEVDYPDGGKTQYCYNDAVPSITASQLLNTSNQWKTDVSIMDGFGRVIRSQVGLDPAQAMIVDTVYDGLGRVQSVSNQHGNASSASDGITAYSYDAIGRHRLQCQPDNGTAAASCAAGTSYLQWTYSGNITTSYDEARNSWRRTSDGLRRLTNITEPGNLPTAYSYDTLGNLTNVTQSGVSGETPRTRNFTYDSLSRLVQSYNPEAGYTCYGTTAGSGPNGSNCTPKYDANGNLQYKTDARGTTTSYSYDELNRLTS
ncbi:MAG: hypothetical protein M3O02_08780 [Acidobacteriota bacterium]|nr:hypothetical protein [Acidobacteriota bacterium]